MHTKRKNDTIPLPERTTVTVREAIGTSGLGATTIYALIAAGDLKSIKIGRRRLIIVSSLLKLLEGDRAA